MEFFAGRKSSKGFLAAQQGADVGAQYRSVIFYRNNEQRTVAEQVIKEITAAGIWDAPIVTQVEPLRAFYKAEDYHQKYFDARINIIVGRTEFDQKQNWWHVFGDLLSGYYYTFEVVVDARTGAIRKSMLESHANDITGGRRA